MWRAGVLVMFLPEIHSFYGRPVRANPESMQKPGNKEPSAHSYTKSRTALPARALGLREGVRGIEAESVLVCLVFECDGAVQYSATSEAPRHDRTD
jgi:hypothetical protein